MRKFAAAIGAAALLAVLPFATTQAQDAPAMVTVVHGIGVAPNTVDIYIGAGAAPSEWNLAVAGVSYGEDADLGNVPAGTYNVLLCTAVLSPPDTITSCASDEEPTDPTADAVNGNSGTEIELAAGDTTTLVASYSPQTSAAGGRPTVVAYPLNADCVNEGTAARATAVHAANAPAVDVTAEGGDVFTDLEFGESDNADVPAGAYDIGVELASDGTPVLDLPDTDLAAEVNTVAIVVGNGDDAPYEALVLTYDLEPCAVPVTTSTTAAPTTTSTVPARPAAAQPRFTG